jgi:type III restriction enzyme
MLPWYTGKPVALAQRSHINFCVADSTWEAQPSYELDHNPAVAAWAKNDHLGFEIGYSFAGEFHKFRPDFLIRLKNGVTLVLETKGHFSAKDDAKRKYLAEWISAVNAHRGFGQWTSDLALKPSDVPKIISKVSKVLNPSA